MTPAATKAKPEPKAEEQNLGTAPSYWIEGLRYDPEATIHARMARILAELPAIGKDQRNEQQNFMYRGYDDVLNALNPLMAMHGVYLVPNVIDRVATDTRRTGGGKTMYEVNLHVRFRFYGLAGDYVEASGWGEGTDMADKATNKAMTMALKYVLFQTFAISTAEASDTDATTPEETTTVQGTSGGSAPEERKTSTKPKTWKEIQAWFEGGYDRETWTAMSEFISDACEHLYGIPKTETPEQRSKLGAITAEVAGKLYELVPPGGAAPPSRVAMQEAWFSVLNVLLEGPSWRMGPEEADRPVRSDETASKAVDGEGQGNQAASR